MPLSRNNGQIMIVAQGMSHFTHLYKFCGHIQEGVHEAKYLGGLVLEDILKETSCVNLIRFIMENVALYGIFIYVKTLLCWKVSKGYPSDLSNGLSYYFSCYTYTCHKTWAYMWGVLWLVLIFGVHGHIRVTLSSISVIPVDGCTQANHRYKFWILIPIPLSGWL